MNVYPILLTLITFLTTFIGGYLVVRRRTSVGLLAAFASGSLIAVSLLDIIPETVKMGLQLNVSVENVMLSAGMGFLFLLTLHRHIFTGRHGEESGRTGRRRGGIFATSEICAHSYIEGVAIGLGFQFDFHVGLVIAMAVIAHDFSDGLSTVTVMLESGNSLRSSMWMLFVDAITPLFGAVTTLLMTVTGFYVIILLPFIAGGLLYLGAGELLPEAHSKNPHLITLLLTILGFAVILATVRFLG